MKDVRRVSVLVKDVRHLSEEVDGHPPCVRGSEGRTLVGKMDGGHPPCVPEDCCTC